MINVYFTSSHKDNITKFLGQTPLLPILNHGLDSFSHNVLVVAHYKSFLNVSLYTTNPPDLNGITRVVFEINHLFNSRKLFSK